MKIYKHSLIAVAILAQGTVGMASQSKDHTVDPETLSEPNHKGLGAPQGKPRTTLNTRQLKAIKGIGASATGYYLRSLRADTDKVDVCHKDENGIYKKITIAHAAHEKHVAHGDVEVGGDYPNMPGYAFGDDCPECKPNCLTSQPDAGCGMVGCGSCLGGSSCLGATGTIGDGSCTEDASCIFASGPSIGDGSCTAPGSCIFATGTIGDGSCTAEGSCYGATGTIGDGSCNYVGICYECTADVGDNECNSGATASDCPCINQGI